jgi:putative salt-induced outer membrane protein YdiY
MSNYDHDVLGTGNPEHPYNKELIEEEIFESDNIQECMDYSKLAYDYEPLENAVYKQETIIEKAISEIDFCIDILHNNSLAKNRLLKVKHLLMSNQIKRYES